MSQAKKDRRKCYRCKKKLIHKFGKEKYEPIFFERLKKRWQNNQFVYEYNCSLEEELIQKEAEKLEQTQIASKREKELAKQSRLCEVEQIEDLYNRQKSELSALMLDEVVVPVDESVLSPLTNVDFNHQIKQAREERNKALALAKHYRDVAETCHRESLMVKYDLEIQG